MVRPQNAPAALAPTALVLGAYLASISQLERAVDVLCELAMVALGGPPQARGGTASTIPAVTRRPELSARDSASDMRSEQPELLPTTPGLLATPLLRPPP